MLFWRLRFQKLRPIGAVLAFPAYGVRFGVDFLVWLARLRAKVDKIRVSLEFSCFFPVFFEFFLAFREKPVLSHDEVHFLGRRRAFFEFGKQVFKVFLVKFGVLVEKVASVPGAAAFHTRFLVGFERIPVNFGVLRVFLPIARVSAAKTAFIQQKTRRQFVFFKRFVQNFVFFCRKMQLRGHFPVFFDGAVVFVAQFPVFHSQNPAVRKITARVTAYGLAKTRV